MSRYRASGATPPFGDLVAPHAGIAFEGWFWRLTHVASGTVVIVLLGVNRDRAGATWGTVGLAAHPGGFVRDAAVATAWAAGDEAGAGDVLRAGPDRLRVDLGPGARLDVRFDRPVRWPRRAFGALGAAQAVPGLSQYWHPYLLAAGVTGIASLDDRELVLDGATAYAEKNWGSSGFPPAWWWGQAHGFERDDLCVAFAGGLAGIGAARVTATSLVVRMAGAAVRVVRPLMPLRVGVDEHGWRLAARTPSWAIEVEGHANGTAPHMLPVPLPRERRNLEGVAAQHLAGELRVHVRRRGRTVVDDVSRLAGLERGGPPAPRPGAPPA